MESKGGKRAFDADSSEKIDWLIPKKLLLAPRFASPLSCWLDLCPHCHSDLL